MALAPLDWAVILGCGVGRMVPCGAAATLRHANQGRNRTIKPGMVLSGKAPSPGGNPQNFRTDRIYI